MLYIFLHIDSTQGGWGRGMGNKSDKVSPSLCLSLSRFYPLCPRWLKLYLLHFLFIFFLFFPRRNLLFSSICISIALCLIQATLEQRAGRIT